ncbi:DNA binding helix-turn helix protein [Polaribacter sp. MED152]|nr:DNA binding helix-turn helix protein [Polaribacter sp. MED152]
MGEKAKEKEIEKSELNRQLVLKKIVDRRKELGLTQWDISEQLNLTYSGYFKVETGKTKLDVYRLFEILDTLNITPKEFFEDFEQ